MQFHLSDTMGTMIVKVLYLFKFCITKNTNNYYNPQHKQYDTYMTWNKEGYGINRSLTYSVL